MHQVLALSRPLEGLRRTAVRARARGAALWRAYPRELLGAGLLTIVAGAAIATSVGSNSPGTGVTKAAPPAPPPLILKQVAPEQALKLNAEIPVASGPNPSAAPFIFKGNAAAKAQALNCLASAVYYEAGNQDEDGERAVAQVVLNRVRHPAFPATVCGVVYQGSTKTTGCQFTFTCDGSLNRQPDADGWKRAIRIAEEALSGSVYGPVGWATHYHADYVMPYWASTMAKNAVVGAHLFYRWAGAWGQPAVFTQGYNGHEPNAAALRSAALATVHIVTPQAGSLAAAIAKIPGAEPLKLTPSMRGDKRVAVRFNLVARKAADQAVHEDYSKKFEVSDNLKWSLSSESVADNEKPLGRTSAATPVPPQTGAAGTAASR
jgi:spore germination cell wall hydrolase CwlJ-like protein